MDKAGAAKSCTLGDRSTSDITVRLTNREGRPEWFYSHSSILINKSKFFADQLSHLDSTACIEIHCSDFDYDHHVSLLRLLYLPEDSVVDSFDSVKTAIGILQVAVALHCEEITRSCIQYLEAIPWRTRKRRRS
ncbi:BTB/POZ domain-containing protein [Vitis vinifera]|uniref:BTB/POZ domain-containing protein n=1 Tax=Vitis vinifera TaxID=29760 RepID=A0A438BV50_VITVI|nr:BTB/POZ domain-containing protein [Vitis vinifera]